MSKKHVIIVGAGFAGLTAARELQAGGIEYHIVEARDRIGGRAWTDDRLGRPLELGATWVHWHQPHIWTEITRYQQDIVASPIVDRAYWITEGEIKSGTEAEMDAKLSEPMEAIFAGSREFFPEPHRPLRILEESYGASTQLREAFTSADSKSVMDILNEGDFTQEEKDLCNAYWSAGYIGNPAAGSSLMAKQWAALCDHRLGLVDEQTLRFKLVNGMRGIYENIARDLRGEIRLSTVVTSVEHSPEAVTVRYADGSEETADAAIVTVPVGALSYIDFNPPLNPDAKRVVEEKWNSTGFKAWIKIKGHHSIFGYAPQPGIASVLRSEYFEDDDSTICVAFGADHNKIDLHSVADAQRIINQWRPDLEAIGITGHDWVSDEYSGQAWATLRKGQFLDGWHHFRDTDTALHFAGADWAAGWRGVVVDGAIEGGISTARGIINEFRAVDSETPIG